MNTPLKTLLKLLLIALLSHLFSCTKPDVVVPRTPIPVPTQPGTDTTKGSQPAPPTQPKTITIKVKAVIKIGNVVYDSIPARFTLTTYDSAGQSHTNYRDLQPGVNKISVPANHLRYHLQLQRWGLEDDMILDRNSIQENTVYLLGGSRAAKLMTYEQRDVAVNGYYQAVSRTVYEYDRSGQLSKAIFYSKDQKGNISMDGAQELVKVNGKVTTIIHTDKEGVEIKRLNINYDQQGKVKDMKEVNRGVETYVAVQYTATANGVEASFKYSYSNTNITMDYFQVLNKGNLLKGSSITSNHSSELAKYAYDAYINPYAQMNWPDLFLSRSSKNNVNWLSKEYYGAYPVSDPVNYRYTYDADGYPIRLLQDHKAYPAGNILYTTRTTYHY